MIKYLITFLLFFNQNLKSQDLSYDETNYKLIKFSILDYKITRSIESNGFGFQIINAKYNNYLFNLCDFYIDGENSMSIMKNMLTFKNIYDEDSLLTLSNNFSYNLKLLGIGRSVKIFDKYQMDIMFYPFFIKNQIENIQEFRLPYSTIKFGQNLNLSLSKIYTFYDKINLFYQIQYDVIINSTKEGRYIETKKNDLISHFNPYGFSIDFGIKIFNFEK